MQNFTGVIIEESLTDKSVLDEVKIVSTKVEPVTDKHNTPHLEQWTLHTVEVDFNNADLIANKLSKVLVGKGDSGYWYADYKNNEVAYIIFLNKIFKIRRGNSDEFRKAKQYGVSLGIPEYQVDFSPEW
ncbi:hypothetical protein KAI54_00265 [Candidatus Gracilibacteria bacterium]|nr:hypothetical protein [Candidatus Gracilibacteria bacterium]